LSPLHFAWSGFSALAQSPSPAGLAQAAPITGMASYFGINHKGRTASGAADDGARFTAAHRTLPWNVDDRAGADQGGG